MTLFRTSKKRSFSPGALFPQVSAKHFLFLLFFLSFVSVFPFVDELCECSRKFQVFREKMLHRAILVKRIPQRLPTLTRSLSVTNGLVRKRTNKQSFTQQFEGFIFVILEEKRKTLNRKGLRWPRKSQRMRTTLLPLSENAQLRRRPLKICRKNGKRDLFDTFWRSRW